MLNSLATLLLYIQLRSMAPVAKTWDRLYNTAKPSSVHINISSSNATGAHQLPTLAVAQDQRLWWWSPACDNQMMSHPQYGHTAFIDAVLEVPGQYVG